MRLSVILPAKNEATGLAKTLPSLRSSVGDDAQIIVVDDGSTDDTADVARRFGATVIRSSTSLGNGAAIKRGARAATGDVLVFMDADGQHDPAHIASLLAELGDEFDMVVGARGWGDQSNVGRGAANVLYNRLATWMAGQPVLDLTSGFRVVRAARFREFLHLLPNGFSYPTTITMAFFRSAYGVRYVTVPVAPRHGGRSHIHPLKDGLRFLLIILKIGTMFSPLKLFSPIAGSFLALGLGYYLYTFASSGRFTNMSALLLSVGVLTFLIGMVSEQVTSLLYAMPRGDAAAKQDDPR